MTDRWLRLIQLLKDQQANPDLSATTRKLVEGVYQQANRQGILLPTPDFKDPIFEGMRFSPHIDAENVIETAAELAAYYAKTSRQRAQIRSSNEKRKIRMGALDKLLQGRTRSTRGQPKTHTEKRRHKCWCGCGQLCDNWFVRGHVAKIIKILTLIEQGRMTREALPAAPIFTDIHWRRCKNCKGWMPTIDLRRRPEHSLIGWACKQRLGQLKRLRKNNLHSRIISRADRDKEIAKIEAMIKQSSLYKNRSRSGEAMTPMDIWAARKEWEAIRPRKQVRPEEWKRESLARLERMKARKKEQEAELAK